MLNEDSQLPPLLVRGCLVILFIAMIFVIIDQCIRGWKWYEPSMVLEAFGTLISALAFWGVVATVSLQSRELALQRQELAETRRELQRQATAQEQSLLQAEATSVQTRLGNMFPQFLKAYSEAQPTVGELLTFAATVEFSLNESNVDFADMVKSRRELQGLYRLNVFCDLLMSHDYSGATLDRRAYATIITTELHMSHVGILAILSGKAIPERLSAIIQLLYVHGDLAGRVPDSIKEQAKHLVDSSIQGRKAAIRAVF